MAIPASNIVAGIAQSDIIIKTAIEAALNDIRNNSWLLDYCFNSLQQDPLVAVNNTYSGEIEQAKQWIKNTNIPVALDYSIHALRSPIISIELASSNEAESTLGDVHGIPEQDVDPVQEQIAPRQVVLGPFTPASYNPSSGQVTIPPNLASNILVPGMLLISPTTNTAYAIQQVTSVTQFNIAPNTNANFTNAIIIPPSALFVETVESCLYRETYNIGCHVSGEPVHLTYLYSLLIFILLRYKQYLLENRGFDRTIIQAGRFEMNELTQKEVLYSRYIQITGYVRHMWPKLVVPKIGGMLLNGIQILGGGVTPESVYNNQVKYQNWEMDGDKPFGLQNPGNPSQVLPGNPLNNKI